MKQMRIVLLLAAPIFSVAALGQATKNAAPPTVASAIDREISLIENETVEAAQAMPEEKFNFSPESLHIPGAEYKGVRTFASEFKHIAASNYALWSPITGDKFPDDFMGGDGPEKVKTKAEIIQFPKDSFALGHKAAATLTAQNIVTIAGNSKSTPLYLATFGAAHALITMDR